jgi:hypothetical protein
MPQERTFYFSVPKKTIEFENSGNNSILEEYDYYSDGIALHKIKIKQVRGEEPETITTIEPIMKGNLNPKNICRLEFCEGAKEKVMWEMEYEGKKIVGDLTSVCEEICSYGKTSMDVRSFKNVLSAIIRAMQVPTKIVYPTTGFFLENNEIVFVGPERAYPLLDTQKKYVKSIASVLQPPSEEKKKEVLQASVDFITAMPERNKNSALISRGFSFVAPLGYVLKQTPLGVFPYLYLYGEKGSSKTHIADVSATYTFGETDHLTSDSVNSAFRLGIEFASCTFPRVIDEAHDVFIDNISTFKSAATSTIATKRGNKDKTLDAYPSFCPPIFTSNMLPITVEQDQSNALMDRIIIDECFSGQDFDKEKYRKAHLTMIKDGWVLGNLIIRFLSEQKIEEVKKGITEIADYIQDKSGGTITQRRAYCLAYLVWGIESYTLVLAKHGIENPWGSLKTMDILEMVVKKSITDTIKDEDKVIGFLDWAFAISRGKLEEAEKMGIFEGNPDVEDSYIILLANSIRKYAQHIGIKHPPYSSLKELAADLGRIGIVVEPTGHKTKGNDSKWGIKVGREQFNSIIECKR